MPNASNKELETLKAVVENLRDNHVAHLAQDIIEVKTDVAWLKQFFWIVAGTSAGGLVAGVINLLIK